MNQLVTSSVFSLGQSYVRAGALLGLADMLEGVDLAPLLHEAGLSSASLVDPESHVSAQSFGIFLHRAATELQRPGLGLEWARSSQPCFPQLGPMVLACRRVATMRGWIESVGRYWPNHLDAYRPVLISLPEKGAAAYRFDPKLRAFDCPQIVEHLLGTVSLIFETLTGITTGKHVVVRFRHGQPRNADLHRDVFACPIEFDSDHNEIVFADTQLDRPFLSSRRHVQNYAAMHLARRIALMPGFDGRLASWIAVAVRAMMGVGIVDMTIVAATIGLNPKTLQRRLAEEGTSFARVLDEVRQQEAVRLVAKSRMPLGQIGAKLDYSSAAAFNLAFKRWTGVSPRSFRQAAQAATGFGDMHANPPADAISRLGRY